MYQTIYIDIVFLTNFLMDYMLLRLVGRFLHLGGSRFRCLASAALGAGFSCLLLYMPVRIVFPVAVLIHGSCAFFMAAFAFRLKRGCLLAKTILAMYLTGRDLSGAGNRRNHDRKNFSAFSGRNLWQSLHTDLCGRNFPAVPEKYLSGNPDISGEKTTVLRLF